MRLAAIPLLLTLVIAFLAPEARAGHLVGGEISYYHVAGDTYVIQLRMYRDCYASAAAVQKFDSVAYVSAYKGWNHELVKVFKLPQPPDSTRLPLVVDVPCLPNPPDLCILEMVYTDTIVISIPNSGLYLVNQRCCRTPNALNIVDPFFYGSTYAAFIPGANLFTENSSPVFNKVPPIALCAGIDLELDYSATDPDGDSLYYDFCTPLHGAGSGGNNGIPYPDTPAAPPFDTVQWVSGFSKNYQLPSSPAFEIDHQTGIVSGRPNQLGTYVFGVCVQEYRDGVFLGENRRDFQMTTTTCEIGAAAIIDSAIEECIGQEIQFFNLSTLGESFFWDFGDTASVTDTSSEQNPTYQYPDTGWYTVQLISYGAAGCNDTSYFDYHVLPEISPSFDLPPPSCFSDQGFSFKHQGVFRESTHARWELDGQSIPIPLDHPGLKDISFGAPGLYSVKLIYEDFGCIKTAEGVVEVYDDPTLAIIGDPLVGCAPVKGSLESSTKHAYLPSFEWFIGDSLASIEATLEGPFTQEGVFDVRLVMTTDSLCKTSVSQERKEMIHVMRKPAAEFEIVPEVVDMYHPEASIVSRASTYWMGFQVGDSSIAGVDSVHIVFDDTGTYAITQVVMHENGCSDTLFKSLRVEPEFLVFIPNSFSPNGDGFNDVWKPEVFVHRSYQLQIFDRWGEMVFASEDPAVGWNGRQSTGDREMPIGTYGYNLYVENPNGMDFRRSGTIYLIR